MVRVPGSKAGRVAGDQQVIVDDIEVEILPSLKGGDSYWLTR